MERKKEFERFLSFAAPITPEYLRLKLNRTEEIETRIKQEVQRYLDSNPEGLERDDELSLSGHIAHAENEAIQTISREAQEKNQRCPYELEEITKTLTLFSSRYDLDDPRAYIIISSIIQLQLTTFRLERYSVTQGPINRFVDKFGNNYTRISDLEDAKRRFHESLIKSIEQLDKIFEGTKVSITTTTSPKEFVKLFSKDRKTSSPISTSSIPRVEQKE